MRLHFTAERSSVTSRSYAAAMTTPPERLRTELERHRTNGRPFSSAWPAAMTVALGGLPLPHAIFWRQTFSEQRLIWQANYSGPCVTPRLFAYEREHRDLSRTFVAR